MIALFDIWKSFYLWQRKAMVCKTEEGVIKQITAQLDECKWIGLIAFLRVVVYLNVIGIGSPRISGILGDN